MFWSGNIAKLRNQAASPMKLRSQHTPMRSCSPVKYPLSTTFHSPAPLWVTGSNRLFSLWWAPKWAKIAVEMDAIMWMQNYFGHNFNDFVCIFFLHLARPSLGNVPSGFKAKLFSNLNESSELHLRGHEGIVVCGFFGGVRYSGAQPLFLPCRVPRHWPSRRAGRSSSTERLHALCWRFLPIIS